ncbi:hypothetical protein [Streptomyces griseomycini]|uniref:Uncharacterized protein n=1 Tax=Streptomyces griseomycini TaxID=66895 RepID=A0A7W7PWC3_9ACTN|nr:hypothetical protein [Streptomyces griseomycini]MBB4902552.1 hypothetical protein [Streptomyces griseomycini]GGR52347.1 hypothetical protein GCM10015536_67440 [Streptomyces griseomycini]
MTGEVGHASVFIAPVGTPPDAAGAWTHIGYTEGPAFEAADEAETAGPPPAQAIEGPR